MVLKFAELANNSQQVHLLPHCFKAEVMGQVVNVNVAGNIFGSLLLLI
jgi:hypothetical protein